MYIDRFDINGNSIANRIYHLVESGQMSLQEKLTATGDRRLDQYAHEYYGSGLNWWIIASASGLGWWFNLTKFESGSKVVKSGVRLYIPTIEDIIKLKQKGI
jgi:hypothetical protein